MSLVQGCWRKKIEILPLLTGEEKKEPKTVGAQTPASGIKICIPGRKQAVSSCNIVTADHFTGAQPTAPPQNEQASFGVENF